MNQENRIKAVQFPHNPRKITPKKDEQLEETMHRFGDISGVTVNRRTGHLIAGNQRSRHLDINNAEIQIFQENDKPDEQGTVAIGAINHNGMVFFYREVDWPEEKEKEANIIANKGGGDWDFKLLEEFWETDLLLKTGFKKSELKWTNTLEAFSKSKEALIPDAPKKVMTKPGDIYRFGDHALLCGDSTDPDAIADLIDGAFIHQVVTDPPYNVNYQEGAIENDHMPEDQFRSFMRNFYTTWTYQLQPGGTWYIFHADTNGHIFRQEFMNAGNYLAQVLTWVKDQKVMGRSDYHWQHEPCIYGIKPDPDLMKEIAAVLREQFGVTLQIYDTYHQNVLYGWRQGAAHRWETDRAQSTVLNYNRPRISDLHPTMKPIGMLEYLIHNNTVERQTVADPFAGSGSTMMAAENTNRKSILVELDPSNCDTIIRRWVHQRQEKEQTWSVTRNGKDISKQKWLIDGAKAKPTQTK